MEYPRCALCHKIFKNRSALKVHQTNRHKQIKHQIMHVCNICKKSFKNVTGYNNHLKKHKHYLRCNLCGYVTTAKDDLKSHVIRHQHGAMFCLQCNAFYDSEKEHCSKHTAKTNEKKSEDDAPPPDTVAADGSFELNLPFVMLDACQQLCSGQILQMSGKSSNAAGIKKEDVSLCAIKRDNCITLILQAASMGSMFQQKLSQSWQCEITSSKIIKADDGLVQETNLEHPNTLEEQMSHDTQQCTLSSEEPVDDGLVLKAEDPRSNVQPITQAVDKEGKEDANPDWGQGTSENLTELAECTDNRRNSQEMAPADGHEADSNKDKLDSSLHSSFTGKAVESTNELDQCSTEIKGGNKEDQLPNNDRLSDFDGEDEGTEAGHVLSELRSSSEAGQCQRKRKASMNHGHPVKSGKYAKDAALMEVTLKRELESETVRVTRSGRVSRSSTAARETKGNSKVEKPERSAPTDTDEDLDEDKLQNCVTIINSDRKLNDEIYKLNSLVIKEMFAAGEDGVEKLDKDIISDQLVCIMCMKAFRRKRWYFFCRHIEEVHFLNVVEYRKLLLLDSSSERRKEIQFYRDQQLQMTKEYKEVRYKVKKDQLIQCPGCTTVLSAFGALCAHIRSMHMDAPNYLDLVRYAEELRENRRRSSEGRSNTSTVVLKCDYCGAEKVGMNGIKVHLRMAHPREPDLKEKLQTYRQMVKEMNLRLRRKQYCEDVKKKTKGVACRYCGEKYSFRSSRGRHEKYSCELNPNRIKTFTCQYCDHRFFSKEELTVHRREHIKQDFKYVCDVCGIVRRTKAGMYDHKKIKHSTAPPKHKCPHCEKMFHNKDRLNTHITVHSDTRPFQCEVCGSSFKTRASVVKHLNAVHYNKYTYYCDKCGHGVSKMSYLRAHKCGRIRRSQGSHDKPPPTRPSAATSCQVATPIQAQATIALPELTPLPKMDAQQLIYDDKLNKDATVVLETELAPHILMEANIQMNAGDAIQTVSVPYSVEGGGQQLLDVLPQNSASSGFGQEFGVPQVTVIEYANGMAEVDTRTVKLQYAAPLTDQNAL